MKKTLLIVFLSVVMLLSFGILSACGNSGSPEPEQSKPPVDITGITFSDYTCTYDGTEKKITVNGTLPSGVSVTYSDNKATDAGVYNATANLSGEGYNPLSLNACLTINKADITGLSVEQEKSYPYDGKFHKGEYSGNLPEGVTTKIYINNIENEKGVKDINEHSVKIVFSGKNFNDLILEYKLKIESLVGRFKSLMESFGEDVPNPWEYLPDTLKSQNKTIAKSVEYDDFVSVSDIPKNGIGKQLNVVYSVFNKTAVAFKYVDKVYAALDTVKTMYLEYVDKNPDSANTFEGSISAFSFKITAEEDLFLLNANIGTNTSVQLFSDIENKEYGAKIQLPKDIVLKYTVGEDDLIIAMNVLNYGVVQINLHKENGKSIGYIYETLHVGTNDLLSTSAYLYVDDTYTTLIGNKGDFIPTSGGTNCEVYRNSDGNLVGTDVREIMDKGVSKSYDTLWYNLYSVVGIDNIKKEDTKNGANADTIYINNANKAIHSKTVGGLDFSRRFDIEFKKMFFYSYNSETEEYEETSCEIPMLFIQKDFLEEFVEDFSDKNKDYLTKDVSLNVVKSDTDAIDFAYNTLLPEYDAIKELVTYQSIVDYCKD